VRVGCLVAVPCDVVGDISQLFGIVACVGSALLNEKGILAR
jgi:hypothetical protein